jgi:hypothetical protein
MSSPNPAFVVERYWPGSSSAEFERATTRLAAEIAALPSGGFTLLHAMYVPADEAAQR